METVMKTKGSIDTTMSMEQQEENQVRGEGDDTSSAARSNANEEGGDKDKGAILRHSPFWNRLLSRVLPEKLEDQTAVLVAVRIGTALAIASLFTFVPDVDDPWPDSYWVYITSGVVSWLLDTGNVAKKTMQRIAGTAVGCSAGLAIGFLSVQVGEQGSAAQGVFLGLVVTTFGFLYPFIVFKHGYFSSYGTALATITFGLVVLVWYDPDNEDPWETGLWRVVNIIIGSIIAAACSLLVFPVSTKYLIQTKVEALVKQTGEATKAVFDGGANVSEGTSDPPPSLWDLIQNEDKDEDEAHKLYIASMNETRAIKAMFPTLQFDLTFRRLGQNRQTAFVEYMRLLLGKIFRMQIALVMLDTLVRANLHRGDKAEDPVDVLRGAGERISIVHDRSLAKEMQKQAVLRLIHSDLPLVREHLIRLKDSDEVDDEMKGAELMDILMTHSTHGLAQLQGKGQSTLFWRIVEHLILRTIRFHGFCLAYETATAGSPSSTPQERPILSNHAS